MNYLFFFFTNTNIRIIFHFRLQQILQIFSTIPSPRYDFFLNNADQNFPPFLPRLKRKKQIIEWSGASIQRPRFRDTLTLGADFHRISSLPRLFRNAIDSRVYRCRGLKRDAWYVLTVACHVHAPVTPVKQRRLGRKPRLDRSIIPQKLVRRGQSCALEADRGSLESDSTFTVCLRHPWIFMKRFDIPLRSVAARTRLFSTVCSDEWMRVHYTTLGFDKVECVWIPGVGVRWTCPRFDHYRFPRRFFRFQVDRFFFLEASEDLKWFSKFSQRFGDIRVYVHVYKTCAGSTCINFY